MTGVLVFIEHAAGEADRLSREALVLAGSLARSTGGTVSAVLIGPGAAEVAGDLGGQGVGTAYVVNDPRLAAYAPAAWAAAIAELIGTNAPAEAPRRRAIPGSRRCGVFVPHPAESDSALASSGTLAR